MVVLSGMGLVRDVPYTGPRYVDTVGAVLSVFAMGGIVLSVLVWQEGGEAVAELMAIGGIALAALVYWLRRRKREGKPTLFDPDLFNSKVFRLGISQQTLQQIALGGTMIALPIYLQMVFEYNAMEAGLSLAPLSLSMFGMAILAARKAGTRRPSTLIRMGFALFSAGIALLIPIVPRADSGWYLVVPLAVAGLGLGLLVSQLNNYTLAPISEERVSEAAGLNSAAAPAEKERVAKTLEDDAEVMTNTSLEKLLADEPQTTQDEIISINTDARPLALQVALLIPLLAGLIGLFNSFRMMRLPEPKPAGSGEAVLA